MSETFENDVAAKLAELRVQRNDFVARLQKELETAGFTVEVKLNEGIWGDGHLKIRHKTCKAWENNIVFDYVRRGYNHRTPCGLKATYNASAGGWKTKSNRFTKLDGALVLKLVALARLKLDGTIKAEQQQAQFDADDVMWQNRRKRELKGLVMPPATRVNIISGNGLSAGLYKIEFDRFGGSILDTPLSREQVFKLAAILNELQSTAIACVLTCSYKDADYYLSDYGWMPYAGPAKTAKLFRRHVDALKASEDQPFSAGTKGGLVTYAVSSYTQHATVSGS
jgi:hypothetical protein